MTIGSAIILATVVGISDGDTITALTADKQQIKVRLAAIDAPERKQPFGTRSREALAELCFNQQAKIQPSTTDRYGRTVGTVQCRGKDAGANQVSLGMAWVYERYATGFERYYTLQAQAQTSQRGIWSDPAPVAPWDWRKTARKGH